MRRKLFISPAEVRFIEVFNGRVLNIPFIKSKHTGFCLTFVLSMGYLKRELVEREVRVGSKFVDFGTPRSRFLRAIEIDGQRFHSDKLDIVADQQREDYLHERGWVVLRIPARRLWREPEKVRKDTLKFLRS